MTDTPEDDAPRDNRGKIIDDYDPHAEIKAQQGYYDPNKLKIIRRGEKVNMNTIEPTIRQVIAAIGWDFKKFDRDPPDMDASVFLLGADDKTREDKDFVFYNNDTGCDGAVKHGGDSRTGAGDGDDEVIYLNLEALPFDVVKIVFTVSIYDLEMSEDNFTHVKNVYFRVVNEETEHEMFRFELDEELEAGETGLIVGEMNRIGAEWEFTARGDVVKGGLGRIASDYGIIVMQHVRA